MMHADIVTRIRKLHQQHAYTTIQLHEAVARRAGLSGTDHKYLGFLMEKGEMTAGELAGITGLTTGAVTGLIDRLEKKKLVKRQLAEDDRRKVIIVPNTVKIMALFKPLYKDYRSRSEQLLAALPDRDARVIEAYFLQAIELMNDITHQLNSK